MASKHPSAKLKPFEFHLDGSQKLHYEQVAAVAGISLSELARRSINNYAATQELRASSRRAENSAMKTMLEVRSRYAPLKLSSSYR